MNVISHLIMAVSLVAVPFESVSAQVSKEHQFLLKHVGHWDAQIECWGSPEDKSPQKLVGQEINNMLGDYWLQSELSIDSDGKGVFRHWSLGYSPVDKKYIGVDICAISPYCQNQSGSIDSTENKLTMMTIGKEVIQGTEIVKGKLIIETVDPDHRKFTYFEKMDDSDRYWKTMEIQYVRNKDAK